MRVKIISDGTVLGTKVINQETGEILEGVSRVHVQITAGGEVAVHLYMRRIPLEIEGEVDKVAEMEIGVFD